MEKTNTNANVPMTNNKKYFIVLRDKNNALRGWKAYEDMAIASDDFTALGEHLNNITDGDYKFSMREVAYTDGENAIYLREMNPQLLLEMIFTTNEVEDIFETFLAEREEKRESKAVAEGKEGNADAYTDEKEEAFDELCKAIWKAEKVFGVKADDEHPLEQAYDLVYNFGVEKGLIE